MISFDDSYELPVINELQVKEEKAESVDPRRKIPFPFPEDVLLSRHVAKEREEKSRWSESMCDPASM